MSMFTRVIPNVSRLARTSARFQLRCYASSYPPHTIINMPALSPTMTQGNLAVWSKQVGDKLSPGEVIAEVETDKAQMDFEFQEEGYLAKVLVPEGTKDVPVNKPIAVYVEEEGDVAAFKDFKLEETAAPAAEAAPAKKEEPVAKSAEAAPAPAKKPAAKATSASPVSAGSRIIASPLAKTIALDKGISLREVTGTGPNGRITKADVEAYLAKSPKKSETQGSGAAAPAATASYNDVPISNMRKVIGSRLLQSTQSIPAYFVSSNISVDKLLKLRESMNSSAEGEYRLSVNDFLIKAITRAVKAVPEANAYWLEEEGVIRVFNNVDVSVAVATPTGLITPIVKNADAKGLVAISTEVKELGARAKANKLQPNEFQGGTICISNLGMNDAVHSFTSIINPPQSTILAIGTVQRVAVEDVRAESSVSFDQQITITGTFDHRTIDGMKAGEFMKALKRVIENPFELML